MSHHTTDLSGRVALVTGASSGLGLRFSKVLAAQGATVVMAARRLDKLEAEAEAIKKDGHQCAVFKLDVTDRDNIRQVLADVEDSLGMVDILVNNAGIVDAQHAVRISDELLDKVFTVNLISPWVLACAVAKRLIEEKRQGGRIINISSIAGFNYSGNSSAALYSVTKAGIARMTEVLAMEWARFYINVNAIAPGAFHSEMMDGMMSRMGDIAKAFPRQRVCDPALLDSTLLYLASPASEAVTGTVIKVDDAQSTR